MPTEKPLFDVDKLPEIQAFAELYGADAAIAAVKSGMFAGSESGGGSGANGGATLADISGYSQGAAKVPKYQGRMEPPQFAIDILSKAMTLDASGNYHIDPSKLPELYTKRSTTEAQGKAQSAAIAMQQQEDFFQAMEGKGVNLEKANTWMSGLQSDAETNGGDMISNITATNLLSPIEMELFRARALWVDNHLAEFKGQKVTVEQFTKAYSMYFPSPGSDPITHQKAYVDRRQAVQAKIGKMSPLGTLNFYASLMTPINYGLVNNDKAGNTSIVAGGVESGKNWINPANWFNTNYEDWYDESESDDDWDNFDEEDYNFNL